MRCQWQRDNRGCNTDHDFLNVRRADADTHITWTRTSYAKRRIALGATLDYRAYRWLQTIGTKQGREHPNQCMCGLEAPPRRHWMWHCNAIDGLALPEGGAQLRVR